MQKSFKYILGVGALILAALACGLPGSGESTATPVLPTLAPPPETLVEAWEQAIQSAKETGEFTLIMNEEDLTKFLGQQLAIQPEPLITEPEITLNDGELVVSGKYTAIGAITTDLTIRLAVSVGPDGGPQLEVTTAELGPLPVPPELLEGINLAINEALSGKVATTATGFSLTGIVITDGLIAISGTINS